MAPSWVASALDGGFGEATILCFSRRDNAQSRGPVCHFANRHDAWQSGFGISSYSKYCTCDFVASDFATLPTHKLSLDLPYFDQDDQFGHAGIGEL
jgi:hypothetical protein